MTATLVSLISPDACDDFRRVRRLAAEYKEADRIAAAQFKLPQLHDYGSEAYIRAEIAKTRVIRAKLAAEQAYHAACDEYFLTEGHCSKCGADVDQISFSERGERECDECLGKDV